MRTVLLFSISLLVTAHAISQNGLPLLSSTTKKGKPALELTDLTTPTPSIGDFAAISRDGLYCGYTITGPQDSTIIQSTESGKKYYLPGIKPGFFSGDNRHFVYQTNDSLCYLSLHDGSISVQNDVVQYQVRSRNEWLLVQFKDSSAVLNNCVTGAKFQLRNVSKPVQYQEEWFVLQLNKPEQSLMTVYLPTGKVRTYKNVFNYGFDRSNRILILQTEHAGIKSLEWADALSGHSKIIWSGDQRDNRCIGSYNIDQSKQRIVFTVKPSASSDTIQSLWYYKQGMKTAVQKKTGFSDPRFSGLKVSDAPEFSRDGRFLVFSIRQPKAAPLTANPNAVQVDVWHYRDTVLMSAQLAAKNGIFDPWATDFIHSFSTPSDSSLPLKPIAGEYERVFPIIGEYAIIQRSVPSDRFWESQVNTSKELVSLKDGKRIPLKKGISYCQGAPDGTWLLCYNSETGQYLRLDPDQGQYRDLSGGENRYFGGEDAYQGSKRQPWIQRGLTGWLNDGKSLLVYDHYDIWLLDVAGKNRAVNLTHGRKKNTRFEAITEDFKLPGETFLSRTSTISLRSLNMTNLDNTIYSLSLNGNKEPEPLFGGPYTVDLGGLKYGQVYGGKYSTGRKPLKATDANVWLVLRQSTTEYPNYYVVRDSNRIKPLSSLMPAIPYNWLVSSLAHFTQTDGSTGKGILYKPENFDPSKKYPVILHYYDQFSACLNQYPVLGYTSSAFVNIPWFVSRGYLVFLPDIYFNKGAEGGSAAKEIKIPIGEAGLNAIEGAAAWLSQLPFVDSTKLAIAGHSMGGGITNYILTHSNRFAAVFEGAGVSNWISGALQLAKDDGTSRLGASYYSGVTGSDIWTNNTKYLDNPILHVASVSSPLLIFHCKNDSAVPFEQAVELFVAMRRMGKKAWLLQYDQGTHLTMNNRDSRDLTIRATQFFDHYLKGALPPRWMTTGIQAQLKGIDNGLEPDSSGRMP